MKSHLTAISRKKPSLPMRELHLQNRFIGSCLDYGCGKGFDADYFKFDKYDPFYFPKEINQKYDTITCNYVLNVVSKSVEGCIIDKIVKLLKPGGKAYFSVRRDIDDEFVTSKGTFQRRVKLGFNSVYKNSGCEIYMIEPYIPG